MKFHSTRATEKCSLSLNCAWRYSLVNFLLPFVVVLLLKERDWFIEECRLYKKRYIHVHYHMFFWASVCCLTHGISFFFFPFLYVQRNFFIIWFLLWDLKKMFICLLNLNQFIQRKEENFFFIKNRKKKHERKFLTL